MRRRLVSLAAVVIVALGVLAACGTREAPRTRKPIQPATPITSNGDPNRAATRQQLLRLAAALPHLPGSHRTATTPVPALRSSTGRTVSPDLLTVTRFATGPQGVAAAMRFYSHNMPEPLSASGSATSSNGTRELTFVAPWTSDSAYTEADLTFADDRAGVAVRIACRPFGGTPSPRQRPSATRGRCA